MASKCSFTLNVNRILEHYIKFTKYPVNITSVGQALERVQNFSSLEGILAHGRLTMIAVDWGQFPITATLPSMPGC